MIKLKNKTQNRSNRKKWSKVVSIFDVFQKCILHEFLFFLILLY
jgi:hypothetical protein